MRKIIFIICMFLNLSIYAKEWNGIRISENSPDFDGWSMCHAGGGAVFYGGMRLIGMKPKYALITSIFAGYFYEIYKDGLGNEIPFTDKRDENGADLLGDPIWTAFGAGFMCLLELVFDLTDKIQFIQRNGKTGIVIKL